MMRSTSCSCTLRSMNAAINDLRSEMAICTCSISPVSPLSEESSGGSKGSRPWEGALFGATTSVAPAPETPPLQASPDLPPPPGLGKQLDFVVGFTSSSCICIRISTRALPCGTCSGQKLQYSCAKNACMFDAAKPAVGFQGTAGSGVQLSLASGSPTKVRSWYLQTQHALAQPYPGEFRAVQRANDENAGRPSTVHPGTDQSLSPAAPPTPTDSPSVSPPAAASNAAGTPGPQVGSFISSAC